MSRSPRVLVSGVCLGQPMGGVRRHNEELLPRLDALLRADGGSLAVLEGRTPIEFELPETIERIPGDVPFRPAPRRALFESRALREALEASGRRGVPFDLVHTAHLPAPHDLAVPFTITIHDLRSLDLDSAPFVRRLLGGRVLGRAFHDARRITCVTEAMRVRIEEEFDVARGKVDMIGNGADHLPLEPRAPADPPFLLHVGHVEPRKNLELLVRALADDSGLPRVVLAGAPKGDTREALLSLASELGVRARVEFVEAADDATLARLYASAACAVFPSRLEGFGIGPAEALRAGCPVAVSDIEAHREVTGTACETFAPDDAAGLARAVHRSVGRQVTPDQEHSWDDCAERWIESLRRAARA